MWCTHAFSAYAGSSTGAHGACVQAGLVAGIWRGGHRSLRRVTRPPGPPVRGAGVTLPPRTTHSSSTQGRGISTLDSTKHKIRNRKNEKKEIGKMELEVRKRGIWGKVTSLYNTQSEHTWKRNFYYWLDKTQDKKTQNNNKGLKKLKNCGHHNLFFSPGSK